ncbi:hypothetical protein FE257_009499 [Aspergillus nanangensis]|uniref:Uncharacterized protein n=1 Tax=Aspergillus nanangensis TaxID=2582783 RepID=A0AAD4CJS7_ASPNN|nr:hypothetical protein FE257_009499 [Aspergillus nanangensis]
MGIPMYREPSVEAPRHSNFKDPCAAARSAIRRQGTIRRPSRYPGSALRSATLRSPFPRTLADDIDLEANLARHNHTRSPIPNPGTGDDPFDLTSGLADTSVRDAGQRLLNDVLRHSRPGQRMRIPRHPPLPSLYRRPSPGEEGGNRQDQEHPPFTPRFAPAIAYHRTSSPQAHADVVRLSPFPRTDGLGGELSAASTIPLLRRVGQRSINEPARSNRGSLVDGLGDRQRSVSPDADHANDAWETLLTTITPDTNLPSADSSFTSASASGTNSTLNGTTRSSATSFGNLPGSADPASTNVQMVLDPYPEFLNPCDYSSTDSDSESEAEISQQSLFRRYRRRMREMDAMRRSHNIQSAMGNPPTIPTISFAFSDTSSDPDLHQMQAILDRLARREDIPDDWWAAAGLARTIAQREGLDNGSNRADGPDGPLRQS